MKKSAIRTLQYGIINCKVILSLILFIIVYLFLLLLLGSMAYGIIFVLVPLIFSEPHFDEIFSFLLIFPISVLNLFYILKYSFKKDKLDESRMVLVDPIEEPELFKIIKNVADEVKADLPKKVYIIPEVNACIFNNSNFRSMFFPIKKNLQIGLGLINSVTVTELKAILAHEFGHSKQKSTKIGTYVHNINHLLLNLTNENEEFENSIIKIGNKNILFGIVLGLAFTANKGIKELFNSLYKIINCFHSELSRKMEFDADKYAAYAYGSQAMIDGLLRIEFANIVYEAVFEFYDAKHKETLTTENIYENYNDLLFFLGKEAELEIKNNLPYCTVEYLKQTNKSKLSIDDKWASHPDLFKRIETLTQLNCIQKDEDNRFAKCLIVNNEKLQKHFTYLIFKNIQHNNPITILDKNSFLEYFKTYYSTKIFNKIFKGYYDFHNPSLLVELNPEINENLKFDDLFSSTSASYTLEYNSLTIDSFTLNSICAKGSKIKSFYYDGIKYKQKHVSNIMHKIANEAEPYYNLIEENDKNIHTYFTTLARKQNKERIYMDTYSFYINFDADYNEKYKAFDEFTWYIKFLDKNSSFRMSNLRSFQNNREIENEFKRLLTKILSDKKYRRNIDTEQEKIIRTYLSEELIYLEKNKYNEEAILYLNSVIQLFPIIMSDAYMNAKKELLNVMAELQVNTY